MSELLRVLKSGRAFNGWEKDRGKIVHLIEGKEPNGFWGGKALCGATPGMKGNGWCKANGEASCEKCLKKKSNDSIIL